MRRRGTRELLFEALELREDAVVHLLAALGGDVLAGVAGDLEDEVVGDDVAEDGGHGAEDGEDPHAEVGEDAEIADGALLEFFFREGEELGFSRARLFRGVHDVDAGCDAEQAESSSRGAGEGIVGAG